MMTKFELDLINEYTKTVGNIIDLYAKDICVSHPEYLNQIDRTLNNIGDTWNECLLGMATIDDFRKVLASWYSLNVKIAELGRPPGPEQSTRKLTRKQELFVKYYVEYGNGAKAARLAGYSVRSAPEIAFENLRKPNIQQAIQKRLQKPNLKN